jgi:hypothetical protein
VLGSSSLINTCDEGLNTVYLVCRSGNLYIKALKVSSTPVARKLSICESKIKMVSGSYLPIYME